MSRAPIKRAALNNAVWCDTVCRTHGRPGVFTNDAWVNGGPTPRFYPNVVTLAGEEAASRQLESIRDVMAARLPDGWAVKDSFTALDLTPLAFHVLFEAEWLYRPASSQKPDPRAHGVEWARLEAPPGLAEWERAWRGCPNGEGEDGPDRIFLPGLLEDGNVAVLAARREGRIVAGAIANRTVGEAGLSNFFAPEGSAREFLAGLVALALEIYPGLPLVDYERGRDLEPYHSLGFETVGPLRVWISGPECG